MSKISIISCEIPDNADNRAYRSGRFWNIIYKSYAFVHAQTTARFLD